ncbi:MULTISPECIES: lipocalin family protein [Cellulophaga]|uniref:lipocalin family protein n=1 Tax=Cellulophaga TaxID=104264 RepID=UPI0026E29892|nr:lipocalin family protein [Cellulophaga sp. 1_MG-2023]MDO6769020.1 lipocalin family protein [Cellulophaga sp. 1_MG-2023]
MGSWTYFQEEIDGELVEVDDCDKKNTVVFNEDMSFEFIAYGSITGDPEECEIDSDSDTGEWSIPSEGVLAISYASDNDDSVEEAMYTIDGDTLTITSEYENNNGETESDVVVYIRK